MATALMAAMSIGAAQASIGSVQAPVDITAQAKVFDGKRVLSERHAAGIEDLVDLDITAKTKRESGLVVFFAARNLIIDAPNDQGQNHRHLTGTFVGCFVEQLIRGVLFNICHRQNPTLTFGVGLSRKQAWPDGAKSIDGGRAQRITKLALCDDWSSQHNVWPHIDANRVSWKTAGIVQNEFYSDMQPVIIKPKTSASGIRRFVEGNISIDPRPLAGRHAIQLPLHYLQLVSGGLARYFNVSFAGGEQRDCCKNEQSSENGEPLSVSGNGFFAPIIRAWRRASPRELFVGTLLFCLCSFGLIWVIGFIRAK